MESLKGYLLLLKRVTEGLAILYLLAPNLFVGIEERTQFQTYTYILFVKIVLFNSKYIKELKLRLSCDNNTINKIKRVYACVFVIIILTTLVMTILDCCILHHIIWTILDIITK